MKTTAIAHTRWPALAKSAVSRVAQFLLFGLIGWIWFLAADSSAGKAVSLVAIVCLAALGGITWHVSRARAERRWRAALDRYAEQEQSKRTYQKRRLHEQQRRHLS